MTALLGPVVQFGQGYNFGGASPPPQVSLLIRVSKGSGRVQGIESQISMKHIQRWYSEYPPLWWNWRYVTMETHPSPPPPLTGVGLLARKGLLSFLSPPILTPSLPILPLSLNTWSPPIFGSKSQFSALMVNSINGKFGKMHLLL